MNSDIAKKSWLTLSVKMKIIREVDRKNRTKTAICQEFGIPNSTLSTIMKNREKIREDHDKSDFEPERKRMRTAKSVDVENAFLIWFKQARCLNYPVSGWSFTFRKSLKFSKRINKPKKTNSVNTKFG